MSRRYATGRFTVVALIFAIGFAALVSRFAWVQVVRAEHWRTQADHRSTGIVAEPARRGQLLDRSGRVLAATEVWTVVGVSRPAEFSESAEADSVAQILGLSERGLNRQLNTDRRHVVLGEHRLDPRQRQRLQRIERITLEDRPRRVNPHGDVARQLLGWVQASGDGVSGLEAVYDDNLAGEPGTVVERRDADGVVRERRVLVAPIAGSDLSLSLDIQVQAIVERELERARVRAQAHRGQAIVLDPATGDVIALAQMPLHPEPLPDQPDLDPQRVMAATDQFEPGSVFKLFTAASLLRHGVCDTSTVYDGMREFKDQRRAVKIFPGNAPIRDIHPVGVASLRHAFTVSSNIIFATAALEELKRREFNEDLAAFGFGERPGPGFPGETAGRLKTVDEYSLRTHPTMAIGQEVGVSLLQLTTATAALVSDGVLRAPRFVRCIESADGMHQEVAPVARRNGLVSSRLAPQLRAMCAEVVASDYGTGEEARVDGIETAGKTGTAQVSDGHGYLSGVYTPSFLGFVPAADPRLIVAVVLHRAPGQGVYGGNSAAPCFAAIVREVASSTTYLDVATPSVAAEQTPIEVPRLIGRSVEEIRALASKATWGGMIGELPSSGRVVGQIPRAGARVGLRSRIQLAFFEGAR